MAFRRQHNWPVGKGQRKTRGVLNSTERKFLEGHIAPLMLSGEAVAWWYERWTWALTESTPGGLPGIRYTPDFIVLMASGELVAYEVKGTGNARRQDLNRTKLFADLFPLRCFVATAQTQKDGGGFAVCEY